MPQHYRDLAAWQKAIDLVLQVYRITAQFPDTEKFGLVNQLRRATVSVASNIAEGQGRLSVGEFRQFLSNARGSLHEVGTQLFIAEKLGYLSREQHQQVEDLIDEVGRLINSLIRSLSGINIKETEIEYGA